MSESHLSSNSGEAPKTQPSIDILTGLPNRAGLIQELENKVEKYPGSFALVFIDVDGLKRTNDTEGHAAGDVLIKEAASILQGSLRTGEGEDVNQQRGTDQVRRDVFRLAGDEFVALLSGVSTQESVDTVITRLQSNLLSEGSNGGIRASMGGRPHKTGEKGEELLDAVDKLMYEQKNSRKEEQAKKQKQRDRLLYRQELESLSNLKLYAHFIGHNFLKWSGVKKPR